jgi:hypothetical protein
MRPRTIHVTTILAVALGAAGCAERPVPVEAEPAPTASAGAASRPAPRCDDSAAMRSLAAQLGDTEKSAAMAQVWHFRPLCDAEGYPLVGNLARKGSTLTQPSELCAGVRALEKRR